MTFPIHSDFAAVFPSQARQGDGYHSKISTGDVSKQPKPDYPQPSSWHSV